MGVLTIRSLDDAVLEQLRQRAVANGRSAEAEARVLLAQAVSRPDRESVIAELRAFRASLPPITSPPFTEDLLREDRDR